MRLPRVALLSAFLFGSGVAQAAPSVTVSIDISADAHAISPLIYGANFPSQEQSSAGQLTLARWGGNTTSRYNYENDVWNTGLDYYFENIAGCWSAEQNWCSNPPADPKTNSGFNAFVKSAGDRGQVALLTIPTLGWIAKSPAVYNHPFVCGCTKSEHPNQDDFDPYDSNCGNGRVNGQLIDCGNPTDTSVQAGPAWTKAWVQFIVKTFGPANGKRIYALDNEPNLWDSTHHDVHPEPLTYDELWQKMRDHAEAILEADPGAEIAGPAEWGWPNYFCSAADNINEGCFPGSPDRAKHGGKELMAWLLEQANNHEKSTGKRILHYLDLHYYPQGGSGPERTRSLWDPSYTDPSWIGDKIRLLPRMHDWVNQNYPGTKLAVSEYDFYEHDQASSAVTYAEVLGIFGREEVSLATAWGTPDPADPAFAAYRLFRNYDGKGAAFGSTSAKATVDAKEFSGASPISAFAATAPGRLTIVLANRSANTPITVQLGSFQGAATAALYVNQGAQIKKQADLPVQNGAISVPALSSNSIALLAVDGDTGSGGAGGSGQGGSGSGGSGGFGQAGSGGAAGSGTAGSGTAGSGTAGSGTAGSGTAGSGTAGSGTAGSGTAGQGSGGNNGGTSSSGGSGQAGGAGGKGGTGSSGTSGQGGVNPSADGATSEDDGGCGCRVAPGAGDASWSGLLVGLLALASGRRGARRSKR